MYNASKDAKKIACGAFIKENNFLLLIMSDISRPSAANFCWSKKVQVLQKVNKKHWGGVNRGDKGGGVPENVNATLEETKEDFRQKYL